MKVQRAGLIALGTTLVFAASACSADTGSKSDGPIRIGLLNTFTGGGAAVGQSARNGVELAVDELNKSGGVNGRQIELVREDAGSTPATAVSGFKRLQSENISLLIGTPLTSMALALDPLIASSKMPTFIYASGLSAVEAGRPWAFRFIPDARVEATVPIDYAVKTLKLTKIAILHESSDFGNDGAAKLTARLDELGLKPVTVETNSVDVTSLQAQITSIKSSGAQALMVWETGTPGPLAIKTAFNLNLDIPLFTTGAGANANVLKTLSEGEVSSLRAALVTNVFDPENAKAVEFNKNYKAKYNITSDQNAAAYYDAAYLAAEALKNAKDDSPEAIRDAIAAISGYKGASNTYDFDDDGNCCNLASIVEFDSDKKPKLVQVVESPFK